MVIPSDLLVNAPDDMFAALGKDDQKIYVVPSQNLVVIRQGEAAGLPLPTLSGFDNTLWAKIGSLNCMTTGVEEIPITEKIKVYPNPASDFIHLETDEIFRRLKLSNILGQELRVSGNETMELGGISPGIYALRIEFENNQTAVRKVIIQ